MTRRTGAPWGDCLNDDPLVGLVWLGESGECRGINAAARASLCIPDGQEGREEVARLVRDVPELEALERGERRRHDAVRLVTGGAARVTACRLDDGFLLTMVPATDPGSSVREVLAVGFGAMVLSVDGRIRACNAAFAELVGYEEEELVGLNQGALTTPHSGATVREMIRARDETPYEVVALRKDGSTFPARIQGRNVNLDGVAARLTTVADLTAEREAQRALEEREDRYRELAEMLPVAVVEIDLDGMVTFANARAMRSFDWSAPQGARLLDLVVGPQREGLLHALRGGVAGEVFEFRRVDGRPFEGRVFGAEVHRRGRVVGMRAVVVASDELPGGAFVNARRIQSLGALAGGLAHDFNNLLAAVRGNADLARRHLPPDHAARRPVDAIVDACSKGALVTTKLLASSGAEPLALEPVRLGAVVEDTVDALWEAVEGRARLRLVIDPDVGWVEGAANQLSAVIVNLVLNAAEAVEPPGWVELELRAAALDELPTRSAEDDGSWLCLRVRDDGAGMDAETLARAFEPYFTTKLTGRGLGLSAVQGIVQSHGGFVRLESEVGRGTTVEIVLPEAPPPASERSRIPSPPRSSGRRSVLVADDEPPLRIMLRAMLDELGYDVIEAEDGIRCLEVLRDRPDVSAVILDATMPRMGGAEVLRIMHEEQIDVPVVLCSGFPTDVAVRDRVPFRFLAKPFGFDELERTLRAMIER